MFEMLAAYHFSRYIEQRREEKEPRREYREETGPSLAIQLFRRMQSVGRYRD